MTKLRRRGSATALLLAVVTLVATACGSATGHRTNLQLYNDKAAWTPFYKQMSSLAHKDIGVKITPSGYADEPTYQAFVKSSLKTRVRPDLFTWSTGPALAELAQSGQLADTSALWQKAIADGDLPQSLEQYYTINGRQYCIPENTSYWVMFYNKRLFAKAGIPAAPTSWQDLMADAAKLKQQGTKPFYQTNILFSFVWFQTLLAGTDPDLYNRLTQGKASYTDPGVVKVMQQWRDLIKKGYMSDAGDKTDPAALLKSGKVAMVPNGTWFNTSMTQAGLKPGSDYGVFAIPSVNPALKKTPVAVETGALCMPKSAYDLPTDLKFGAWWLTAPAQTVWANSRGDVSANPKVRIPDPNLATLTRDASAGRYQLFIRYFDAVSPTVLTAALDAFGGFMANPDSYQHQLAGIQRAAGQ
jgi:multiple sugar transport system substrate-binding protein